MNIGNFELAAYQYSERKALEQARDRQSALFLEFRKIYSLVCKNIRP